MTTLREDNPATPPIAHSKHPLATVWAIMIVVSLAAIVVSLFAIRFDGSEVAVTGLPATISTKDMPTTDDGISRAIGYQAGSEPIAPVPPAHHDWPFHLFLLLLIPAGALLWVALRDRSVKAVV